MSASPPTDRVIDILELLSSRPASPLSLTAISREVEQNLATCHAVAVTLEDRGWLARNDETKEFSLGVGALSFGQAAAEAHPVVALARSELQGLASDVEMQATNALPVGEMLTIVDAVGGVGANAVVGHRVPHAPPFGSVFLAWGSEQQRASWLARTPGIADDLAELIGESLDATRERGYAIEWHTEEAARLRGLIATMRTDPAGKALQQHLVLLLADLSRSGYLGERAGDTSLPVSVVTAPVMDARGDVACAIAVQPLAVVSKSELKSIGKRVVAAAKRIEAELGQLEGQRG